jgi:predicted AlkP superfamily phosphohydrolase/phosphomutase
MWPSLFTSVNPAKHGRYFGRQVMPGSYQATHFREDTDFKRQPIWVDLSQAGRRVAVIDMARAPLTKDLNGIQLVDWMTHDSPGPPRSWPHDLISKVIEKFGEDPFGGVTDAAGRDAAAYTKLCKQLMERVGTKTDLCRELLDQGPWDLFMTVYADPHDVGHQCWHIHDSSHPKHDAALLRKIGDPLKKIYMAIDKDIGRLISEAGPDARVMVFTGPGMGPEYTANFLLDQILRRLDGEGSQKGRTYVDTLKSVYRAILPPAVRNRLRGMAERSEDAMLIADRSRRKYFAVPHNENSGAIRINLIGREASGKVNPGPERDTLVEELTNELRAIVNLDTGEPIVEEIVRVAETFKGEHVNDLPDLLVIWNRRDPISAIGSPKIGEIRANYAGGRTGDHTAHGLFFASGKGLSPAALPNRVSVMDIGMTICSWLDVAPEITDGSPIVELCE